MQSHPRLVESVGYWIVVILIALGGILVLLAASSVRTDDGGSSAAHHHSTISKIISTPATTSVGSRSSDTRCSLHSSIVDPALAF